VGTCLGTSSFLSIYLSTKTSFTVPHMSSVRRVHVCLRGPGFLDGFHSGGTTLVEISLTSPRFLGLTGACKSASFCLAASSSRRAAGGGPVFALSVPMLLAETSPLPTALP